MKVSEYNQLYIHQLNDDVYELKSAMCKDNHFISFSEWTGKDLNEGKERAKSIINGWVSSNIKFEYYGIEA